MIIPHLIAVILCAAGIAIAIVEKGRTWPIKRYKIYLKVFFNRIHPKLPDMLSCAVCTSFWASLVAETLLNLLYWLNGYPFTFLWPVSGFASLFVVWFVMDFLNTLSDLGDKETQINVNLNNE